MARQNRSTRPHRLRRQHETGGVGDAITLLTTPDGDRLYFVVETKSSLFASDLRNAESAKIECGRAHFKALAVGENPAINARMT
jgi:restriction endonuclease